MTETAQKQLGRLINEGLGRRTQAQLWHQARDVFTKAGEPLAYEAFRRWLHGLAFPSTRRRQLLLAEVIGGTAGAVIAGLPAPAFRGFRHRVMKEKDNMPKKNLSSRSMNQRPFPLVRRTGEDGVTRMEAEIKCAQCSRAYHYRQHGSLSGEEYFKKKGWDVGNNANHDYCPICVEAKRKVVKMSDHKKPESNGAVRAMTKEDGRLIFKAIEGHWDDNLTAYHPGWSDTKVAEENGVPIDWVREIRDRDYGGAGEDPGVAAFVAEQLTLKGEMADLGKALGELEAGAATVTRLITGYKEKHNTLSTKVHRLTEVAGRLRAPFRDAG